MSSIKAGGRAELSSKAENLIVSLLYDLRNPKNPLERRTQEHNNNDKLFQDLSSHDQSKEKRRFLRRLVEAYERQALTLQFNSNSLQEKMNKNNKEPTSKEGKNSRQRTEILSTSTNSIGMNEKYHSSISDKTGKVRFDIVEAIYKKTSTNDSKEKEKKSSSTSSSKKSKKSSEHQQWKEGTRKTMVLPRSTPVKDLLKVSKSKLRMKKNPTKVFFLDSKTKIIIELVEDTSGVKDGTILYVTSHDTKEQQKSTTSTSKDEAKNIDDSEKDSVSIFDPLEQVKKAYRSRKKIKYKANDIHCTQEKTQKLDTKNRFPSFGNHLNGLEPLSRPRLELPAASYRTKLLLALDRSRVLIICGETGCGKSTQIPQYILEGCKAIGGESMANILVTQPRRVAATSLAMRVSKERNGIPPGKEGSEVGYNIRLSKAVSKTAKIVYCTVGVLLRMIVNTYENEEEDNYSVPLSEVSHVVIDEVHERDLNTDFVLTLLRRLLTINKSLSIILMSATASVKLFMDYFSQHTNEIKPLLLRIPGRTYPVKVHWLHETEKFVSSRLLGWTDDILEDDNFSMRSEKKVNHNDTCLAPRAMIKIDNNFILNLVKRILKDTVGGAILIFLPGKGEIEVLARVLYKDRLCGNRNQCSVIPLHSSRTPSEQWLAFQPPKEGIRKIVLATNVAETSITIPDISFVIDTGRVKESRFNESSRIKDLVTVWTSQASAKQRAGRGGRTGPGECYRLYTENFFDEKMPQQTTPEVMRTPLDELVLQICLLEENQYRSKTQINKPYIGSSPIQFLREAPETPPIDNLIGACKHLVEIGCANLICKEPQLILRLTPLGYHLSHLPMDPNVGKILIIGSMLECIGPALTIAASLSCTKKMWLQRISGSGNSNSRKETREIHERLVENGFGGKSWKGGTVKGDLIALIAAYNEWDQSGKKNADRKRFAEDHALDHNALFEMRGLRTKFLNALKVSGLFETGRNAESDCNNDNALLTSCCLVGGLYPNVAALLRPNRANRIRGRCLFTKDGSTCLPSSDSFQLARVKNASETGNDVYAVYHSKHRSVGTMSRNIDSKGLKIIPTFLSDVNFISRYSLLLFGGQMKLVDNFITLDGWLKFKVGDKGSGRCNVYLMEALRQELDNVVLEHVRNGNEDENQTKGSKELRKRVIDVLLKLLEEE